MMAYYAAVGKVLKWRPLGAVLWRWLKGGVSARENCRAAGVGRGGGTGFHRSTKAGYGSFQRQIGGREMPRSSRSTKSKGKLQEITVLHTDLRAFCEFNSELQPTELAALMDTYYKDAATIVRDEGGTVDKFIGDTVLACFNAPTRVDAPETRAVNAALKLKAKVAERWPTLPISIGIATGMAVVGYFGPPFKRAYTAFGDVVGRARVLERRSHNTGFKILVDQTTRSRLPKSVRIDEHPKVEHPTVGEGRVFEIGLGAVVTPLKNEARERSA
jgi:class 3 adenylate cyclase